MSVERFDGLLVHDVLNTLLSRLIFSESTPVKPSASPSVPLADRRSRSSLVGAVSIVQDFKAQVHLATSDCISRTSSSCLEQLTMAMRLAQLALKTSKTGVPSAAAVSNGDHPQVAMAAAHWSPSENGHARRG